MPAATNYPYPSLNDQLNVNLAQIQDLINRLYDESEAVGLSIYDMKDSTGNLRIVPLLVSKTQTLEALVHLNATVKF